MNTPIGRSPSPAVSDASPPRDDLRGDSNERCEAEAAFERVLRAKGSAHEHDDDNDDDDSAGADPQGLTAPPPPLAHAVAARAAANAAAAVAPQAPTTSLSATVEAAFNAPIPPAPAAGDQPQSWEVSLREPLGVPVELRATRVQPPLPGTAAAGWSLTVSASTRDAALLARHAPRLSERLRARALDGTHVRVERNDDEPTP